MNYDQYPYYAPCEACGKDTDWFIDGHFPICPSCLEQFAEEVLRKSGRYPVFTGREKDE